ncbi:uncharacterized protein LOC105683314 [Athalia rosae]|uniref:uncharacterized protein LOC105683314 n=1 Tax=Athalia rosae TaxID=37344 RepID=UPI002034613A|nr:uncharacterized protein LOC105683314 [Athalia rosae]XP_048514378.1 uncharacterized protein LOC105683314 [Athalia rosae]
MSPVYPTLPRLTVRDSFDDEDLSDVDDEVFIRDGRNGGLKIDDEGGVKRPLMAPRRKCKMSRSAAKRRLTCKALLAPCCYGSIALLVLLGLIVLVIFAVNVFPIPLTFFKNWLTQNIEEQIPKMEIAACTSLTVTTVWTRSLPKLTSEAPLRSVDVNGDKIDDIIIGFSTGLDDVETPQYVCNVYFGGQTPCLGGVLALDGSTGETIWTHWTWHVIFSLDCVFDLNADEIKDCIAGGRGGTMRAVNGKDGSTIWSLPLQDPEKPGRERILDVYDANFISDVDGDEIGDIVAAHTMQIGNRRTSEIVVISGKTGNVARRIPMSNDEQLYLAPQTLVHPDGEKIFIVSTGSHEQLGGLYVIPYHDLLYGQLKLRELYRDMNKGILSQPVLADITEDGTEDIIAAIFNSVVVAYDGRSFKRLWKYSVPKSEIISSPIPGYYNDDDIPDFMVKHQVGPGFPVYYYSVATILDGKTGKPLLEHELQDSMSRQMSGLSVTVDGYGNDWFLHWSADCLGHEGDRSSYQFLKSTSLSSQMGADLCKLRFNSTLSTKLLALSQHVAPPGLPLYTSKEWKKLEYNSSIDPRKEAEEYSESRPEYDGLNQEAGISSITERSLRVHSGRRGRPGSPQDNRSDIFSEQTDYLPNSKSGDSFRDRNDNINNPETNVLDDFGSDEDWRDTDKWVDENKDYNILYDEGENRDANVQKFSGIREQRSGYVDIKIVNNDTNDVKNQLDPSMDYTNGQTDNYNYVSSVPSNRAMTVNEKELDHQEDSDFDFDENLNTERVKEKRSTAESGDTEEQKEIIIGARQNPGQYRSFFQVNTRPKRQSLPNIQRNQFQSNESADNVVETELHLEEIITSKQSDLNESFAEVNYARNSSEHSELRVDVGKAQKDANETEVDYQGSVTKDIEAENTWLTGNIFAKLTQSNDEDANIEKIFKRESMKNRNYLRSSKLKMQKNDDDNLKSRFKRDAANAQSQSENIDGVQRQSPTGILLPSLSSMGKTSNAIDLVFSTSWLPPSDASVILLQQDLECIHRKKKELANARPREKKNELQREQLVLDCLGERGVDYKILQESTDRENIRIPLGQMTVYRMKLECVCPEDMLQGQVCRSISSQQCWPAQLGPLANGYFKPLQKPAT